VEYGGQFGDCRRDQTDDVADVVLLASIAFDPVQHNGIQSPEEQFHVGDVLFAEFAFERRDFGGYRGVERTVFLADGQRQQLFMQVIQIGDQVQGVFQMAVFLLAFFAQQVYQIHVPEENLLFFGFVQFAFLHQLRIDRFGTELQGA